MGSVTRKTFEVVVVVYGGMTDALPSRFKRQRFPAEIVAHAVWLYYRFPLSLRHVENLLA